MNTRVSGADARQMENSVYYCLYENVI